jgi:hypothetical protein
MKRPDDEELATPDLRSRSLSVPVEHAESWMLHLHAAVNERRWNWSGSISLDVSENSGHLEVHTQCEKGHDVVISWLRPRNGSLEIEVRWSPLEVPDAAVVELLDAIDGRLRAGTKLRAHRRTSFLYRGLPWRGELWLGDALRLGPPSKFNKLPLGQQAVLVDVAAEGIGDMGARSNLDGVIEELRVFLCVVMGCEFEYGERTLGWASDMDEHGHVTRCELRMLGYREEVASQGMPVRGSTPPIRRYSDPRPDPGRDGYWPDIDQERAPDDIEVLWNTLLALDPNRRSQFLRAASAYSVALHLTHIQPSAHATFLVVACEALKPSGTRYDNMNVYGVVAALLGSQAADDLRGLAAPPQRMRNEHVHRGSLHGGEFGASCFVDFFGDPSFREMQMKLAPTTRACLVEWLRRRGAVTSVAPAGAARP